MKAHLREKAIKLRIKDNLSYSEIKNRLGVAKSTLSYWLKEFPLCKKRIIELKKIGWKKGEASREFYRETMRQRQEKKSLVIYNQQKELFFSLTKNEIFIAGLMLYASEGDKKNYTRLVLANTDPKIISFYIYWLKKYFKIERCSIKIQLHLYENMDIDKETNFWIKELNVNKNQFYKPTIRKLQKYNYIYEGINRHGTCSAYALGVENKQKVMMAIKAFFDTIVGI